MKIIDITRELFSAAVYPGDTPPSRKTARRLPADGCNLTDIALCVHNGTHIDAPLHFIENGAAIDEIALDVFFGPCRVAALGEPAGAASLAPFLASERLLIKGDALITGEMARAIAKSGIRLLGVESQSVGPAAAPAEAHTVLLGKGIVLLEGLDLSAAAPGLYTLAAFPLKLAGCEGSPARAVLLEGA
ncbi:MAG: cyclase family protein [Gracilibacteraceae bacterium]|nr:cyclase family protein [Gracilibacteraceae bacterium]